MNCIRGPGYVLDFSDRTYSEFFAQELDVDIDDPRYAREGTSKGARLRCFLKSAPRDLAVRTLKALWQRRVEYFADGGWSDTVPNAEGKYRTLLGRIEGTAEKQVAPVARPSGDSRIYRDLADDLLRVHGLEAQARGYAFEGFLKHAFDRFGLEARTPFRNIGEQIDGSFMLAGETYLLEAKWRQDLVPAADLRSFQGKLNEKAKWARGLFVSYYGFSAEGLDAFGRGKSVICMSGKDIHDSLLKEIPLSVVLDKKVRIAAETGCVFVPLEELFR